MPKIAEVHPKLSEGLRRSPDDFRRFPNAIPFDHPYFGFQVFHVRFCIVLNHSIEVHFHFKTGLYATESPGIANLAPLILLRSFPFGFLYFNTSSRRLQLTLYIPRQ